MQVFELIRIHRINITNISFINVHYSVRPFEISQQIQSISRSNLFQATLTLKLLNGEYDKWKILYKTCNNAISFHFCTPIATSTNKYCLNKYFDNFDNYRIWMLELAIYIISMILVLNRFRQLASEAVLKMFGQNGRGRVSFLLS